MKKFYSLSLNPEFKEFLEEYVRVRPNNFVAWVRPKHIPDEFIVGDGHPNEKGHAEIANDLFNYLTKNRQIICH